MGLRPSSGVVRLGGEDAKAKNADRAVRRGWATFGGSSGIGHPHRLRASRRT